MINMTRRSVNFPTSKACNCSYDAILRKSGITSLPRKLPARLAVGELAMAPLPGETGTRLTNSSIPRVICVDGFVGGTRVYTGKRPS